MSESNQPAAAYDGVEQENDPAAGTGIAAKAPAGPGTTANNGVKPDVRWPPDQEETGFPSGPTNTPSDEAQPPDLAPADTDDPVRSDAAGSSPATWPEGHGPGVSGTQPGEPDLESWGGTGLTTHDTEDTQ